MTTTCAGPCDRPVRPRRTSIDDWPGTVALYSQGLCTFCHRHSPEHAQPLNRPPKHTAPVTRLTVLDLIPVQLGDWQTSAACAQVGPEPFFAEHGGTGYAEARKICAACPVLAECRAWVMCVESGQPHSYRAGLVAGMTPGERYKADPLVGRGVAA